MKLGYPSLQERKLRFSRPNGRYRRIETSIWIAFAAMPGFLSSLSIIPLRWAFAALGVISLLAVLLAPEFAVHLPRGGGSEPTQAQLALTTGILAGLTVAYLLLVSLRDRLRGYWLASTSAYLLTILVVKYVLGPSSLRNTPNTNVNEYVEVGAVVLLFYLAALTIIYAVARTHVSRPWPLWQRLLLALALLTFAYISRLAAVLLLDVPASSYLHHVFHGGGLFLPILLAITAFLATESQYSAIAAGETPVEARILLEESFRNGVWMILLYHGLWSIYTMKVFT